MSENYQLLYQLPQEAYDPAVPVQTVNGAVFANYANRMVSAQVQLHNHSGRVLREVKISVAAFDRTGRQLQGIPEYVYRNPMPDETGCFGQSEAFYLPDPTTAWIKVTCTEVQFGDGTVWRKAAPRKRSTGAAWVPLILWGVGLLLSILCKCIASITYGVPILYVFNPVSYALMVLLALIGPVLHLTAAKARWGRSAVNGVWITILVLLCIQGLANVLNLLQINFWLPGFSLNDLVSGGYLLSGLGSLTMVTGFVSFQSGCCFLAKNIVSVCTLKMLNK